MNNPGATPSRPINIEPLNPDKIETNLKTKRIGKKILIYNSTSSTNDIAFQYAGNIKNDGLVIFAEQQLAGRGRVGRKWCSNRSESVLCSILLIGDNLKIELLSLTCAIAVAETIGKLSTGRAQIKWPNDIMLNNKKIAGILLELKTLKGNNIRVIGIGINCHQKKDSFKADLQPNATSIDIENKSKVDRNSLAKRLLTCLDFWLSAAQTDSEKIIEKWRKLSIQLGHRVKLIFNGRKFTGNCIGIDPDKGLILQLDSGGIRMFDAAHTTIEK
jgi:BirA family biotin operon repressor/biotin-[acetyl-CoA-carboxylase] ligase